MNFRISPSVRPRFTRTALCLALTMATAASLSYADFHDRGLVAASARTEYAPGTGTGSNWLTLQLFAGCKFSVTDPANQVFGCPGWRDAPNKLDGVTPGWRGTLQERSACGGSGAPIGDSWLGCLTYPSSPYFSINSPGSTYWVVVANTDPAFDQCNEGPPNASNTIIDPIANPVQNLYKVAMEQLPSGAKRAHMIINADDHNYYCPSKGANHYKIPFLSLGSQLGRGANQPIATMNRYSSWRPTVEWTGKVFGYEPFGCRNGEPCGNYGTHGGFYALANWGGSNKLLFVDLFGTDSANFSGLGPQTGKWNWPIENSFFYPGAEVVVLTAASVLSHCGVSMPTLNLYGGAQNFSVDITGLYACASDWSLWSSPMPAGDISLNGFHFYQEALGTKGAIWTSFENPRVT
jgi:hypothetical protein